jgi:pimeloyl-ACP methyl ester carboxylesterase
LLSSTLLILFSFPARGGTRLTIINASKAASRNVIGNPSATASSLFRTMKKIILYFLLAISFFTAFGQNDSLDGYHKLHRCKLQGIADSVLCGTYPVYENRTTQTGRIINVNIVVIPAIHQDSVLTPIFYFEGGPGVAATKSASFFADTSIPYRWYHDIVLIDIRGTGGSNDLSCPSLQIKQSLKEQFEEMYPKDAVKACFDSLSKRADLTQYTTTNVVKDIEDIRKWLGYGKINIYGLSYGTRVALVYMKYFPSSIESCILWSPVPTYGKMPLYHAKFAQNSLEKIFHDCKQDSVCNNSFPNIETEFKLLNKKSKDVPFTYTSSLGNSDKFSFSWNTFQTKLRTLMYAPSGIRQIPYIVHQACLGNLNPFIALYPKGVDTSTFISEGLYLCITCSEDVPFINAKEIELFTKETFMGTYRIDQQKNACKQWVRGEIPKDFLDVINSNIPTLILSGEFDPITPTPMAKEIASHLSNSTIIIMPQMSHTFDGLSHPECFDNICLTFIQSWTWIVSRK